MIKVLIVDDHAIVRMGIRQLLTSAPDIEIVAEADNGEKALLLAKEHQPDIIVLDMKMPGIDGWEVIRRLKVSSTTCKIIALSAMASDRLPIKVLQLGAMGYLSKESSLEELTTAIRRIHKGERYLSADLAQKIAMKSLDPEGDSPFEELSEREMQVMLMITSGLKVPEIAKRLFLSTKTINCYRYRMFAKLGVKNDVELTHFAIQHHVVEHVEDNSLSHE
ncbi:MAG: response regulator [Gammaproteobacteria bacterium]|nr:response regulator [Gammaproteobacteria bacterium]